MGISSKLATFRDATPSERLKKLNEYLRRIFYDFFYLKGVGLFFLPLGIVFVLIAKALSPWFYVRLTTWKADRIGQQAADMDAFLRGRLLHPDPAAKNKREVYFFIGGQIANWTVIRLIRRHVHVLVGRPLVQTYAFLKVLFPKTPILAKQPSHYRMFEEYEKIPPQFTFTKSELERGRKILRDIGIPEGEPYVCFFARDKKYLQVALKNEDNSYHDYRDCSIETKIPGVELLAEKGVWSLRMGAVVEKPIKCKSSRVIDYASTSWRSDFADIFLLSHCKFVFGGNSGLPSVAWNFNVPVIVANYAPLFLRTVRKGDLFMPKKYWSSREKRFLHFREVIAMGADEWATTDKYREHQIELIENTAEEMTAIALEMNARLDGTWIPHPDDEMLQEKFRALWTKPYRFTGYPSRVGAYFLRENRHLVE